MQKYIGMKEIKAMPMNRGEYNKLRGWEVPTDENPNDEGYLIKYESGYVTWLIKSEFEKVYKEE